MFDGNFDASTVRKHYLLRATLARYVQLWPSDYSDGIALRWEIYGCPGSALCDQLIFAFVYYYILLAFSLNLLLFFFFFSFFLGDWGLGKMNE